MDIENLRTYIALCDIMNFSRTAEELFISQSTVSNRIRDLEAEAGVKLLERDRHTVSMTEEGRTFLEYAKRIVDMEDACKRAVSGKDFRIRIGATNALYESVLKDKLLEKVAQGGMFSVTLGHSAGLLDMIGQGLLDAAYVYQPYRKAGYICEECLEDELVLLCRTDINTFPDGISHEELETIPCAVCNFALQDIGVYLREIYPQGYIFPLEIDNSSKVKDYLDAGLGYSFLPRQMVIREIQSGRYAEIPPRDFARLKIHGYRVCRADMASLLP